MSGPDGAAAEAVARAQYATPDRLSTRISIHDKYSVNRQGFSNWIAEHYSFAPGASVLELGCGTGAFWTGRDSLIRSCRRLILSDFSEGMLDAARKTLAGRPEIAFERIDIRRIPYPDRSFDAVIANMMLYHVPDIPGALREVRRVLREGGTFCCATYGEHGIMEYLCGLFPEEGAADSGNHAFTLQNGVDLLRAFFSDVRREDYPDALAVTDPEDMADYIASLAGLTALRSLPRERIVSVLRAHMKDGVLTVPKEYGLFLAR